MRLLRSKHGQTVSGAVAVLFTLGGLFVAVAPTSAQMMSPTPPALPCGLSLNPVVPGTTGGLSTPMPSSTSLCSSLPYSPDVHVTILDPTPNSILQIQTSVLTGVAYDDRAMAGQSGISQVQVYLNGLAGNNGTTYLGQATLGSGGGNAVSQSQSPSNAFYYQFNPTVTPGTNPNVPWTTGGVVLNVYVFGMNGAVTGVSVPFSLEG